MATTKNTKSVASQSTTPATPPVVTPPAATPPPAPPPDPNAALEQYVQQTVTELDAIEVELGADPALTPAQKRHALKFRTGGEKIVAQLGNLAQQQQLESPALNVAEMLASLGKAQALQPLSDRVHAFAKHVDDVIFTTQSDSLTMAQQFYALLRRRALTDGELGTAMAPVVTFFARKPKSKEPGALTKPQAKATAKAVKTLKKNAPEMLQGGAAAPEAAGATGAGGTGASGASAAGAPAPTAGNGAGGSAGNGAAGPAAPTGASHS